MCHIRGYMKESSLDLINLEPKDIPPECEVIVYGRAPIDENSVIKVDEGKVRVNYSIFATL